jgi:hypothetical protein
MGNFDFAPDGPIEFELQLDDVAAEVARHNSHASEVSHNPLLDTLQPMEDEGRLVVLLFVFAKSYLFEDEPT